MENNESKLRIMELTTGNLIMGDSIAAENDGVRIENPYTVIDFGDGPCVIPYMLHLLMAPMEHITLRMYDVMWNKALSEFPDVETQYNSAISGIEPETQEKIIL